jgi:hypothetical protein
MDRAVSVLPEPLSPTSATVLTGIGYRGSRPQGGFGSGMWTVRSRRESQGVSHGVRRSRRPSPKKLHTDRSTTPRPGKNQPRRRRDGPQVLRLLQQDAPTYDRLPLSRCPRRQRRPR